MRFLLRNRDGDVRQGWPTDGGKKKKARARSEEREWIVGGRNVGRATLRTGTCVQVRNLAAFQSAATSFPSDPAAFNRSAEFPLPPASRHL